MKYSSILTCSLITNWNWRKNYFHLPENNLHNIAHNQQLQKIMFFFSLYKKIIFYKFSFVWKLLVKIFFYNTINWRVTPTTVTFSPISNGKLGKNHSYLTQKIPFDLWNMNLVPPIRLPISTVTWPEIILKYVWKHEVGNNCENRQYGDITTWLEKFDTLKGL